MNAPSRSNLSAWALRNRGLVLYAMIVLAVVGAWSYLQLGQSEDPPFTFRAMVVRTAWPGATAASRRPPAVPPPDFPVAFSPQ